VRTKRNALNQGLVVGHKGEMGKLIPISCETSHTSIRQKLPVIPSAMLRSLAIFAAVVAQASAFAPGAVLPSAARRGKLPYGHIEPPAGGAGGQSWRDCGYDVGRHQQLFCQPFWSGNGRFRGGGAVSCTTLDVRRGFLQVVPLSWQRPSQGRHRASVRFF
jgi:hypothetical protein